MSKRSTECRGKTPIRAYNTAGHGRLQPHDADQEESGFASSMALGTMCFITADGTELHNCLPRMYVVFSLAHADLLEVELRRPAVLGASYHLIPTEGFGKRAQLAA